MVFEVAAGSNQFHGRIRVQSFHRLSHTEEIHVKGFQDALANMKEAQNIGKQITYKSGYSLRIRKMVISCINIKDTAIIKKILLLWRGKRLKKYWQTAN